MPTIPEGARAVLIRHLEASGRHVHADFVRSGKTNDDLNLTLGAMVDYALVAEARSDPHSGVPDTADSFGYECFTLEGLIRKLQSVRDEDPRRAAMPVYVNTKVVRVPVRTVFCEPTHGFPVIGIFPEY